jgi:RNA polymerase sigma factor (sigma-70 family)
MPEVPPETPNGSGGSFPLTHWSVIFAAGDLASPNNQQALAQFCQSYRDPVYFFLRRKGHQPADADDLAQEFFAWFLQKEILAGLTRKGSRFRSYLLTVLRNFLANRWRDQHAQKRGGGASFVAIDADTETRYLKEMTDHTPPETLFDRQWAKTVAARAFGRLREEYKAAGKERLFACLQGCFQGVPEKVSHADAAKALGVTETAARQAAYRLRKRYREVLRMEIAASGTSEEEIDEEIRYLMEVLRGT